MSSTPSSLNATTPAFPVARADGPTSDPRHLSDETPLMDERYPSTDASAPGKISDLTAYPAVWLIHHPDGGFTNFGLRDKAAAEKGIDAPIATPRMIEAAARCWFDCQHTNRGTIHTITCDERRARITRDFGGAK